MKRIDIPVLLVLITTSLAACNSSVKKLESSNANTATKTIEQNGKWVNLLAEKNLAWHSYGQHTLGSAWKIENGILHLDASEKDGWQTRNGGDIVSNEEFENFHLKLEWKISEGGNSGIMFHVNEDASKYKFPWETGPEMQIADNEKNEDGKIDKARAGDLYDLKAISKNTIKPAGQWNQVEIISNNSKLDFYINGEHVLSTNMWDDEWNKNISETKYKTMPGFGTFKKGKIALQDHGADVWFRNIMIKKL